MKTTLRRLLLCAIPLLAIASCVHPREDRIAKNPQIYQSLSTSDQLLVQQGRIREGMTKEGVFLALGTADQVATGRQKSTSIEKWTYLGSQPIYTDSFSMGYGGFGGRGGGYGGRGYGYNPFGYYYSPSIMYVPYKSATVTFRGNRVTEYLTGPQ
jgi:hypothetical protein